MTFELYEMWCSEIYDRDLTSVGRIHDAMIQKNLKKYRVSRNTDQDPLKNLKATKPAMLGHH